MGKNRLKKKKQKKTLVFSVHLETYLLQYMEGHTFFGSSSIRVSSTLREPYCYSEEVKLKCINFYLSSQISSVTATLMGKPI